MFHEEGGGRVRDQMSGDGEEERGEGREGGRAW